MTVNRSLSAFTILVAAILFSNSASAGGSPFPDFADDHTVVLWAFDEAEYTHVTLTDASQNEFDLALKEGGHLVEGKFGRALSVAADDMASVSYAGPKGGFTGPMRNLQRNGEPAGLWGPTISPGALMKTLKDDDWTVEFWLKLTEHLGDFATVMDVGDGFLRGFSLSLLDNGARIQIANAFNGFGACLEGDSLLMTVGTWRHIALTHSAGKVSLFINGKLQSRVAVSSIPAQPSVEVIPFAERRKFFRAKDWTWRRPIVWRKENRFNIALGEDRRLRTPLAAAIDEFRISDVVRYETDFPLPGSFTYNYGPNAPEPEVANGDPLLFTWPNNPGPKDIGSRKHIFIDTWLFESIDGVGIVCNPPKDRRDLNFRPESSAWRPSVIDIDGKVYMYCPDSYGSNRGLTHLRISEDGIHFETPELDISHEHPDCVLVETPLYGTFFHDLNPNAEPWAKYKLTSWTQHRGMYLYVSPDAIHWRRNQTCMLPMVSGGGVETFWDDQLGLYRTFVRRDTSCNTREGPLGTASRRLCMFETEEVTKTWPFRRLRHPYFEGDTFPALTGEGPIVFDRTEAGQVYRSRVIKYPWAPDTYLAFVWRFRQSDETREIDLGVSRDGGCLWHFFAPGRWYVNSGDADEVLSIYGLIRRGDEIWQYVDYGGAHGRGRNRTYARFTQRLDGFTSLDTSKKRGFATSRQIMFEGDRLVLNIAAYGRTLVEIRDEAGKPIPSFTLAECDPIETDAIRHTVTWEGNHDVSSLAGKLVRVHFEMSDAKLFAMQFSKGAPK